jgi:hypothetical protein
MTQPDEAVIEAARLLGGLARRGEPLGPLTTYRVGGPAALFVEASSVDDLWRVADAVAATGLPTLVVGKGSNLLVADAGFPGVAVTLGAAFTEIAVDGARVEAGGAVALPVAARRTVRWGLTGFEWAVGVPGSIGGAVRMNAGGHGSEMAASLINARIVDLTRVRHGRAGGATRARLPTVGRRSPPRRRQRHPGAGAGGPGVRGARDRGDRGLATGEPARGPERRFGLHQPAGRLCGSVDRRRRVQGVAPAIGRGVAQARQLLPGRCRRVGRRRPGAHGGRPRAGAGAFRRRSPPRDPLGGLRQPSTSS